MVVHAEANTTVVDTGQVSVGQKNSPEAPLYQRVLQWAPNQISRRLAMLGCLGARRPGLLMVVSLIVASLSSLGWVDFELVTDPTKLWTPQKSPEAQRQEFVHKTFGRNDAFFQVYMKATGDALGSGHGALTVGAVRDALRFEDSLKKLDVDGVGSWSEVCKTLSTGLCMSTGITRFWAFEPSIFESSVQGNQTRLLEDVSVDQYPDGGQVFLLDAFMNTKRNQDGKIDSAQAISLTFILDKEIPREDLIKWYEAGDGLVSSFVPETSGLSFSSFHLETLEKEIRAAADKDIFLVVGTVAALVVICCAMMFQRDLVKSRISLAMVGIICVMLATAMGFGICIAVGVCVTPLHLLLPFILLGIGVDDMFILIRGLDEAKAKLPDGSLEEIFSLTLETSGVSITLTSLTNLLAFLLGSLSALPAVKFFCICAGVSIVCDYALQITLFLGAMVLTEKRIRAGRLDIAPWKEASASKPPDSNNITDKGGMIIIQTMTKFIDHYFAPFILNAWIRAIVLSGFVALAAAGIWCGFNLQIGQKFSDLVRTGSKAEEFLLLFEDSTRTQSAGPVHMYFTGINFTDPDIQDQMLQSWQAAKENDQFLAGPGAPRHCWLTKLLEFSNNYERNGVHTLTDRGFVQADKFNTMLEKMLAHPTYKVWGEDLVFHGNRTLYSSRFPLMHGPIDNVGSRISLLAGVNKVIEVVEKDIFQKEGVVILYSLYHVLYASDAVLLKEVLISICLAIVGVFIVNLIMLIRPIAVLVMVSAVLFVELGVLTVMWLTGISLSSLTLVLIIMALGLGIDYPVHILHHLLIAEGASLKQQAHKALVSVGPAVGVAFITTLSGILLLGASQSSLFITVFAMLVATVCFAFVVGILYIPVIMVSVS